VVNLITKHMDIWTAAQTTKTNGRGNSFVNQSPHGIKKLRELILELAIRGKLVPQDPDDEPASVLLEKIAREKDRLIKQGKIKKQKQLPKISEDEKHFRLPQGWIYTRNGNLFSLRKGKMPKNLSNENIGLPYLDIEALDRDNILRYTDDERCPLSTDEDILVVCDGSRSGLVLNGKNGVVGSTLAVVDTPKFIQPYVKLLFQEAFQRLNTSMKGAAIPHLDTKNLIVDVIGLPPQNEQHRIVAKVDELMALCDQLEQQQTDSSDTHQTLVETLLAILTTAADQGEFVEAWQRIANHFDTLFTTEHSIDQLKQTILQLAVMGKLVPQDPNDEPASVLLEKIAEEKTRLVKEGKIKKQNPLPEISEDERPFELPKGWEWIRFGEMGEILGGGTPNKSNHSFWNGEIPWISPKDMKSDYISDSIDNITAEAVEKSSVKLIPADSLLIVVRGMILSHSFPVAINLVPVTINQDMKAVVLYGYEKSFILLMIKGLRNEFVELVEHSTHGTCKLVSDKLWKEILAIPPLAEQHRIVAKVDELMALCDTLKTHLNETQITQVQLADAIVERAVA